MLPLSPRIHPATIAHGLSIRRLLFVSFLLLTCARSPYPVEGAGLAPSQVVRLWILFYGQQDTLHAAGFTTAQFRQGEAPEVWAVKTHAALHQVDYQHLGGDIVAATISETEATIVLAAKVHTRLGTITQTETYRLHCQRGRWLIDRLEITDAILQEHKDYGTKPSTTEHKVKVSLRAERRNLCPKTQIASSLIAPRNDTLISSVPLVVQSFVSRS